LTFLDPEQRAFLDDPHAVYDRLRPLDVVEDPLGRSTISYAASEAAFHDTALVPAIDHLLERLGFGALWGANDHNLTNAEGSDHSRMRRALTPWFTPKRVDALRGRTAALVGTLLDAHDPSSPLDVMAELADVVPARVFGWMLGAGEQDDTLFAEWSKALILVFTAKASMVEPVRAAKAEIAEYARDLLEHKRRDPDDTLGTVLAHARD
jgi:cytochrome P450